MPSRIRILKSGFTVVYPPSSGAGSFDSYVDSVASARHIPLNRKRPGIHKYPQQVHLCTRNADADVLPASPLVSSTVDWIQPSRHVFPKSRVAIATQPGIGLLNKPGLGLGDCVAIPGLCKRRRCMNWRSPQRIDAAESRRTRIGTRHALTLEDHRSSIYGSDSSTTESRTNCRRVLSE
jgi:hypothetical protein